MTHIGGGEAEAPPQEQELGRLQAALAANSVGVWGCDATGRLWWSDGLAALFGLPPDAAPRPFADLIPLAEPANRERLRQATEQIATGDGSFVVEFRLPRPAGEPRWLLLRGRVETGAAPARVVHGIVADVTARRRADQALRAAEERYRALVFATADVVWTMTGAGGHEVEDQVPGLADRSWAAFTGQSERELAEEGRLTAVHPDDRDRVARAWQTALAAGAGFEVEYRLRRRDGVYRVVVDRGVPLHAEDDRIVRWIGACADVSERRAAEDDRRREAERQRFFATAGATLAAALDYETAVAELARLIVPAVADACIIDVLEPGGTIRRLTTAASPATQAILNELQTRYPPTLDRPHGVARVIATGEPSFRPVIREERRAELAVDGEHRRLLAALGTRSNITVALVARGEILGALTLKRIQSEVPYDAADLAFAEELARRAALALDNARLLREARAAVRLRDEFLSSASHDLRNPLTTIQGRVQLLQRQLARKPPAPEALAQALEEIAGAARKLQALIDELQDVSSLQIGRPLTLRRRPTDLVALARDEVEQAKETAPRHRLRLESSLPALVANVDPGRLRRVLDNLLANAIKYSPGGGEVVVTLRREGPDAGGTPWAALAVRDRGVGIPAADRPRLFERFYRASNVAGRIAGSGIGLAGVRQIVEQHGGTIDVESVEGQGSTFTVRLPLADTEA